MERFFKTTLFQILLVLFILHRMLGQPLQKDVLKMLLNSQSDANIQQSKQFIGPSVIGGLMWPVLLTLAITGIMARIPDALQRLLSIGGGGSQYKSLQQHRTERKESLDIVMKLLLSSFDAIDKYSLEAYNYGR